MPIGQNHDISSAEELISLAQRLEHQAAINYDRLAQEMRKHQNADTAELFERLAEEERKHENAIKRLGGNTENSTEQLWQFPPEMKLHGDAGDPFLLSPYNAICFAIYNENQTFDLFTQIAAVAKDPKLQVLAENFAKEEVSHIAALRLARLDANKNLRDMRDELGWWQNIAKVQSLDDFLGILGCMEKSTSQTYDAAAIRLNSQGDLDNSHFFKMLATRVGESVRELKAERINAFPFSLKSEETPAAVILACLKYTDQTIDYMTFIAKKAATDAIYARSSEMTERFTRRLTSIRERLATLFNS